MSSIKVMFGLQPHHIARIEEHRGLWMMNSESDFDPFYTETFWEELGREFHWHPLTLCLHYFRIKYKNTTND